MPELNPLDILMRWVHIGSVIVMVGGSVFMRFVLMPACCTMPEAEHEALRSRVMGRWKKFVMILIALLLASGIYNLMRRAGDVSGFWHMLFGIKFLLAFVVFFIASALVGKSKALVPIRQKASLWLGITIAIATVIVMISGVLKNVPNKEKTAEPKQSVRTFFIDGLRHHV